MKKYHYDLCRRRARPATAESMSCVDRSDSRIHHLLSCLSLRRPICRSEHRMTYLQQRIFGCQGTARGVAVMTFLHLGRAGVCAVRPHPLGLSCLKICPSIIPYIFRGKVAVCQKISLKYFSRLRNPASIERVIRLLCVPSALAMSALLIPRKKCA